jgi:tetratricopeptide (TPR) repeat protein
LRLSTALMTTALLAVAMPALAQIRGTVTDQHGQPVAGAGVVIEVIAISASRDAFSARMIERGQKWQAKTNANGEYIIGVASAGVYLVTAAKQGIGNQTTQVTVQPGIFTTANLRLEKAAAAAITEDCTKKSASHAFEQSVLAAAADPGLARLVRWLATVQQHTPGCGEALAAEVGSWSKEELESIFYANEPLTHNEMLRRGAVLHADIAVFMPGALGGEPLVEDGGRKGWRSGTVHWEIGRQLLDSITPSPAADAGALLWYRAVSAYLLRKGHLAEASAHLARARQVFPQRSVFWLDSAYLHQEWSSPPIRAAVDALRTDGVNVGVGSRRAELQRAERFLRQALVLAPDDADARLRLGHTLGELGRHQEAAAELRKAIEAEPANQQLYLSELFLGRQEDALGRRGEAKRRFENAAALYPMAQSPQLALSQLARQSGDQAGAQRALQHVWAASSTGDRTDPWWDYYQPHVEDAEPLMDQMRKLN